MIIDNKQLTEVYVPNIWSKHKNEHFYIVPSAKNYVLSDYASLRRKDETGKYTEVEMVYSTELNCESYVMQFDGEDEPRTISVPKLLAMVFYPESRSLFLYDPNFNPKSEDRWHIKNLHALRNREEIIEAFQAKIEHRIPTYDDQIKGATFINRIDKTSKSFKKYLQETCSNIINRATNPKTKAAKPQYAETTIDPEIIEDRTVFFEWALRSYYDYPGEKLQIDKDLLSFGVANCYSLKYMCFLPDHINKIFRKLRGNNSLGYGIKQVHNKNKITYTVCIEKKIPGSDKPSKTITCNTYAEALQLGRKAQAEYISKIAEKERLNGYMPSHLIDAMYTWADMCELGLIQMWEPSPESLLKKD